jgi:hypothetical protein
LKRHFPKLIEEIGTIIEAFNREVCGQFAIDEQILACILSARCGIRSPRHWPSQVSNGFFNPELRFQLPLLR